MSDVRDPERDQVAPVHNDSPSMHDLVIADMAERKEHGLRKYGTILQANNGRSALQDAYEEVLDLAVYLKQRLEEERGEQAPRGEEVPQKTAGDRGDPGPSLPDWINSGRPLRR